MQPDIAEVLQRLDRLEQQNEALYRQNRLLKWSGVGVTSLFAVAMTVLFTFTLQSKSPSEAVKVETQHPVGPSSTIEAEKFVLKDSSGRIQGQFSSSADGPALLLLDPTEKGKPRMGIVTSHDGTTLSMYDNAGKERLRMGPTRLGPGVILLGEDGKGRASITSTAAGSAVELIDGTRRVELSIRPELQRLAFFEGTMPRAIFIATTDESGVGLMRADKSAVFLENAPDAQRLIILDAKEQPRAALAVTPTGPAFGLFDDKGKELFSKP